MKKIFLLLLIFCGNIKTTDIEKSVLVYDPGLFSKDIEKVKSAIEHKANVNMKDKQGYTPLMSAVSKNKPEIVKLLIDSGANLNDESNLTRLTALLIAVSAGNYEIAKILIDAGADIEKKDKKGRDALSIANEFNRENIIKLIKDKLAQKMNLIDAAKNGDIKIIQEAISNKEDINITDDFGFTPLMRAAQTFIWTNPPYTPEIQKELKNKLEIVDLLIKAHADLKPKDKIMKRTALKWAKESGNTKAAELLQAAGAPEE